MNRTTSMKSLTSFLFFLAVATNHSAARAGTVAFSDDFSQKKDWSNPAKGVTAALDQGGLLMSNSDVALQNTSITHSFLLTGALNYRVSAKIAFTQLGGRDAYAGIELVSPAGDAIGFVLTPKISKVTVTHWSHDAWAPNLLQQTSTALKSELGAINTLTVESNNGAFTVFVNEVQVGTTKAVDFAPSEIGLRGGDLFAARFDDVSLTETTLDTRIARYQLMEEVPGQTQLAFDDFTSYSGLSKLMSLTKDKNDKPKWGEMFDNAIGRIQIDGKRKRMVMEAKTDERGVSNTIDSWSPLAYSGVSINARLNLLKLAEDADCAGIVVESKNGKGDDRDLLFGCINQNQAMLKFFNSNTGKWEELQSGDLVVPNPSTAQLRLVINDDQVLLFVDTRLHVTSKKPQGFRYHVPGVKIDPAQIIEVLEFQSAEI